MFTKPTVIIVGAGASVEFGLPSGMVLRQQLIDLSDAYRMNFEKKNATPDSTENFEPLPALGLRNFVTWGNKFGNSWRANLLNVGSSLKTSSMNSLDEFIFANPRYAEVGKQFAAYSLFTSLYKNQPVRSSFVRNNSHILNQSSSRAAGNWISQVVSKILRGSPNLSECRKNNHITFVTFNYDTLLEEAINHFLTADERYVRNKNEIWPNVIHVNGSVSFDKNYPITIDGFTNSRGGFPSYTFNEINEQSKRIFMIRDDINDGIKKSRSTAMNAIKKAKNIFSIGYAFDETNNSNIGLDKISSDQKLFALNYDGNPIITNRITKFSQNSSMINGSLSRKIGCYDAANLGFFDQH